MAALGPVVVFTCAVVVFCAIRSLFYLARMRAALERSAAAAEEMSRSLRPAPPDSWTFSSRTIR